MLGFADRRDVDDVGPSLQRDRPADRRGVGEVDPVGVRGLQEVSLLVFGGRRQPAAPGRDTEMAAVLSQPALADVHDLLALEQGVDDRGPLLQRGHCGSGSALVRGGGGHARQDNHQMEELVSEGLRLGAHFARPAGITRVPGLLVLPGFPRGAGGAAAVGNTDQSLCDRIARESGWAGLTFTFRGTGPSEGDFSIEGWLADVRARRRCAARPYRHHRRVDRGLPPGRHVGHHGRRRRRTRARHRDLRRARIVAHLGTRPGLVPRVRASHRCTAYPRVPGRSRRVDPRDRQLGPARGGAAHLTATVVARARQRRRRRVRR